jgi:hypothetical protein
MMRPSGHYGHVLRVAVLFGAGFAIFLIIRAALIPADFGEIGFYRAGALAQNTTRGPVFAGESACVDCHSGAADDRRGTKHEPVRCEACHGPSARHADDTDVKTPRIELPQLCLRCHLQQAGKPPGFRQIVIADHFEDMACVECHQPHRPAIDPNKEP